MADKSFNWSVRSDSSGQKVAKLEGGGSERAFYFDTWEEAEEFIAEWREKNSVL